MGITAPYSRAEAERIVRALQAIDFEIGSDRPFDYLFSVELVDGTQETGQIGFLDEKPDSFSIIRESGPTPVHVDIPWDRLLSIGVRLG